MRVKKRRLVIRALAIAFVVWIYVRWSYTSFAFYTNRFWNPVTTCRNSDEEIRQLVELTQDIHKILDGFGIDHWLMYGSIWGAKRMEAPLPWDNDVDLGFHGEGAFSKLSFPEFLAPFKAAGFSVNNKWLQSGTITISRPGLPLSVDLFAFYNDRGLMRRTGIESWLFFLNYNYYHTFPEWTVNINKPLPKSRFGNFDISIPRGELEIMKHLYRDNWWKEVRPNGCD